MGPLVNRRVTTSVIERRGRYGAPALGGSYYSFRLARWVENKPDTVGTVTTTTGGASFRPVGSLNWRPL